MDRPDKCPQCNNEDLRPFRDRWLCIKCNWNCIPDTCDSCNSKDLFTHGCGCIQCKTCPRLNGRFCKEDHRHNTVEKTFLKDIEHQGRTYKTFILNNNKDIVYREYHAKDKSAV